MSEGCEFSKAGTRNATAAFCVKVGAATMNPMLNFADTGGLFDHFEVNREPFWPRIVWLIAGSGAWHLVILALIMMIPPVRDAFSITAMFRDTSFVDRPYTRTEIEDADILDYSGEKFHYPEGYWAMDQQGMPPLPQFPVTPAYTPASVSTAFNPSPTPSVTPTPAPTPPVLIAGNNGDSKAAAGKGTEAKASPTASPDDKAVEQAQKELEAAAKKAGIDLPEENQINKTPLKDLAAYANSLKTEGKLDFNKPFEVVIDTTLQGEKLVNLNVSKKSGDATLIELGKRTVAALNDSGILRYLQIVSKDKPNANVVFTIKQNGNEVTAIVEAEASSPDSAQKMLRTFAGLMLLGRASRQGKDEEILLKKTSVSADENRVVFKLTMPHQEVVDIVNRGMATPSPTVTP